MDRLTHSSVGQVPKSSCSGFKKNFIVRACQSRGVLSKIRNHVFKENSRLSINLGDRLKNIFDDS